MTDSLRDQLLGLGFKPQPKPERKPDAARPAHDKRPHGKPVGDRRSQGVPSNRPSHNAGRPAVPASPRVSPAARPPQGANRRSREDIDLAKAYAIRAQREKDERIEAERLKQEQARERREAKARVAELVKDKALNDPEADIARHFNYGGKIKRVHVNAAQLRALNAGELGVVQMDGRYLLVDAALLDQVAAIFPPSVALKVDPTASPEDDPYADPLYQIPDDLVW
jgi:uncharacterized protein YaiL (DUF2058 family)